MMKNNNEKSKIKIYYETGRRFALFIVTITNSGFRISEMIYCTQSLSRLGSSYQAAAGMSAGCRLFCESFYTTPSFSTSILTAKMEGQQLPRANTQQALRNGQLIGTGFVMITGSASIFIKQILTLLRQPKEQVEIASSFFLPGYTLAQPAIMMTYANEQYLFSLKGWHFLAALSAQLLSTVIYAASPWFDEPEMGARSLGFGTAAQYWTNFILLELYMAIMFGKNTLGFKFNKEHLKQIFKIGLPIFVQRVIELFTVNADVILAGYFGGVSGAEQYSAALPYISMLVILTLGIGNAARPLVSTAMGAKNYHAARALGWSSLFAGTFMTTAIAGVFYFGRDSLAKIFLPADAQETDVTSTGWLIFTAACINIPDLIRNVGTNLVITLNNIWYPVATNSISLFIGLFVSAFLGYLGGKINDGFLNVPKGVLAGQGLGLFLGNITNLAWIRQSISNKAMASTQGTGYVFGLFRKKTPANTQIDSSSSAINKKADDLLPSNPVSKQHKTLKPRYHGCGIM